MNWVRNHDGGERVSYLEFALQVGDVDADTSLLQLNLDIPFHLPESFGVERVNVNLNFTPVILEKIIIRKGVSKEAKKKLRKGNRTF